MATKSQEPTIDLGDLADIRKANASLLKSIIEQYLKDVSSHLDILQKAQAQKNAEEVRCQAHFFRGSSSNFKATTFVDICNRMETQARAGLLEGMPEMMKEFLDELARVQQALQLEL